MKKEFSISAIKAGRAFGNEAWGKVVKWVYLEGAEYPFYCLFEQKAGSTFMDNGQFSEPKIDKFYDLYLLPEEKVWYFNVYRSGVNQHRHDCLEDAKNSADHDCIGHIRITITGTDFKTEDIKLEK